MFKSILAAVDGSEHSFRGIDVAADLAKTYGGTLTILSAYRHNSALENTHSLVRPRQELSNPDTAMHDYTKEVVARAVEYVRDQHGVTAEGYVRRGQPARTIVAVAKELSADTIVLGSRGLGDIGSFLLGSVSHKVTSMAECTTITVK